MDQNSLRPRKVLGGVLFSCFSAHASSIYIAGDFNHWVAEMLHPATQMPGLWQKIVPVEVGVHHYKFLVNDEWRTDPFNDAVAPNSHGGLDSIIVVDELPPAYENGKEAKTGTA